MIVYAPSFAGLVQALKIESIDKLEVLSSNNEIIRFCVEFDISYKNLDIHKPNNLSGFKIEKKKLKRIAKTIKNQDVLFCFYGFDLMGLYFLNQLKKNNTIYFENKDHLHSKVSLSLILKNKAWLIDFLIYKYYLFLPVNLFSNDGRRSFFGIDPIILSRNFKSLDSKIDEEKFEKNKFKIKNKLNIETNAIIFIDQGSQSFILDEIALQWLKENYVDQDVHVKLHPNGMVSNEKLKQFKILPKYIPMELIPSKKNTLIGICSTSLIDKDIDCKKISLINLVKWKNEDSHKKYLNLVQSNEKIQIIENE